MDMEYELPTHQDILFAYQQGKEAMVKLVDRQSQIIIGLAQRVAALENRIAKNSSNSNKPPATDGYQKQQRTQSLRKKSGRKPGGQIGHKGNTLQQVENPDQIIKYPVLLCQTCCCDLSAVTVESVEKRQVFDIPKIKIIVTEHRAEKKRCPDCGEVTMGDFPEHVTQQTQYGCRIKTQAAYFYSGQFTSLQRTQQTLYDLYGVRMNETTILTAQQDMQAKVSPVVSLIKYFLTYLSPVDHFDETGVRIAGKLQWLHSISTPLLTYYQTHRKRGQSAMEEIGILPHFTGKAIHDEWASYFSYQCAHGNCNAHHLRELRYIHERYHQGWAKRMVKLLLAMKRTVALAKKDGMQALPRDKLTEFSLAYDNVLSVGFTENPIYPPLHKHRGRVKHTEPQNLLLRLQKYKQETILFAYDFSVAFDNNQAERDIRMAKLKQKISGCFRTEKNAQVFCDIRSYISTVRKHCHDVLSALESLSTGIPYVPETLVGINMPLALPRAM